MAHPFEKLFDTALRKSGTGENFVVKKATELIEKGYPPKEVTEVLKKLEQSFIDEKEATIVREAREMILEDDI